MKCVICNSVVDSGSVIMGQGFTCSKDCEQIAQARRKAMLDELRAEPIGRMPEQFETADFERFTLKFSVHFIDSLDSGAREKIDPIFLVPEQLSLDLKERIIRQLHPAYVSEVEHRGHARWFSGGTYCFRQPVPCEKIVEAMRKAELIT